VSFIRASVTNLSRPAARVVAFYNQRCTCEQFIKEGKGAIKCTGCHAAPSLPTPPASSSKCSPIPFGISRTQALLKPAEPWSLTGLREKLIKIDANVVGHGRYVTFQMAEVAVPRQLFAEILSLIDRLRAPTAPA
jgi:hypothetical protein